MAPELERHWVGKVPVRSHVCGGSGLYAFAAFSLHEPPDVSPSARDRLCVHLSPAFKWTTSPTV